ncbi:MAG: preprotein translocase subunit SecG [Gammaproteobacteria bacterium]
MSMTFSILLAVHLVLAVLLIGIILMQQGKGATAGAAFGSGASATVFGARGSASFLTRTTAVLAALFLANSMLLAHLYGRTLESSSLLDRVDEAPPAVTMPTPAVDDVPTVPAAEEEVPAAPGGE